MADVTIRTSLKAQIRNAVTGEGPREGMIVPVLVAMLNYDLDGTNGPAAAEYLTLIPASDNPNGLMIVDINAYATELVASDSAGPVLTVRDGASSPNTIDTLTVTDADAKGALTQWTKTEWEARADGTDYSTYMVEAGVKVECAITTAASDAGTVTGGVLVMVRFFQIPSNRD